MASDNEGVPNAVLEAFASGRRVVATDVGGIREVLRKDTLGRLVERRNAAALADGICSTLAEPSHTEEIECFGRSFSWERCADSYYEILERAVRAGVTREPQMPHNIGAQHLPHAF